MRIGSGLRIDNPPEGMLLSAEGLEALYEARPIYFWDTLEKTLEIMDGMAGAHLDPKVVAAVRRSVHDLEWTLDRQKLVLYVLGGRGPDTTRLALQAAAAGLSVIEVQPVSAEGVVPLPAAGGGCGSGGCGCH